MKYDSDVMSSEPKTDSVPGSPWKRKNRWTAAGVKSHCLACGLRACWQFGGPLWICYGFIGLNVSEILKVLPDWFWYHSDYRSVCGHHDHKHVVKVLRRSHSTYTDYTKWCIKKISLIYNTVIWQFFMWLITFDWFIIVPVAKRIEHGTIATLT